MLAEIEAMLDPPLQRFEETFPRKALPSVLWHYAPASSALNILKTKSLWLTAQPSPGDPLEIAHGNSVLRDAAKSELNQSGFPPLARMLNDASATLFAREDRAFVACFTDDDAQWDHRDSGGVALLFDSAQLETRARTTIESSGLECVSYDEHRLRADVARFLADVAALPWVDGWTTGDESQRLIAQYLMEIGGRSFYFKQPQWAWEREWRMVKRLAFGRPLIESLPVEHISLSLDAPDAGIRAVAAGPLCTLPDRAALERELAEHWPGCALLEPATASSL